MQQTFANQLPVLSMDNRLENDLIAMKNRLWLMRFDPYDLEDSVCTHKSKIPATLLDVSGYLRSYLKCIVAGRWKKLLTHYFALHFPEEAVSDTRPVEVAVDAGQVPSATNADTLQHASNFSAADRRPEAVLFSQGRKRAVQHVSKLQAKKNVVKWMVQNQEKKHLMAATLHNFPEHFWSSRNANLTKATRWWKDRESILSNVNIRKISITRTQATIQKNSSLITEVLLKARAGRGRKVSAWSVWLYEKLISEFERLRKAGVKLSSFLLKEMAVHILCNSEHPEFNDTAEENGKLIIQKLSLRWVQRFMQHKNIVLRTQCGKLMVSLLRQIHIDKEIAYHLGVVCRELSSGSVEECMYENVDETHFVVNMDDGKTLAIKGDTHVKYCDVVSGGQGMTMVVRITGGIRARVEVAFLIFQNDSCSYPIRGVPDNVPGVRYRSRKSGSMTQSVWVQWLRENRAQRFTSQGSRFRHVWCDNASGHASTLLSEAAMRRVKLKVRKLVANATDKIKPADSFFISQIKNIWREKWEAHKLRASMSLQGFQDSGRRDGRNSGALQNPGKTSFLKLAADVVREFNTRVDSNGLSLARKAMIQCGLSRNQYGEWKVEQLRPELQAIVKEYPNHFDGLPVPSIGYRYAKDIQEDSE